jgi:hypothetical protein
VLAVTKFRFGGSLNKAGTLTGIGSAGLNHPPAKPLYLRRISSLSQEFEVSEADIKCEMKKTILELQGLATELGKNLETAVAQIEATDGRIGHGLRDLYERANARSEQLLAELDRLQKDLVASKPPITTS